MFARPLSLYLPSPIELRHPPPNSPPAKLARNSYLCSPNCPSALLSGSLSLTRLQSTTEWQRPLSGVHSIMMVKLSQPGERVGVHVHPLSLHLPSSTKQSCGVHSIWEGKYTSPYFYSTTMCTLWTRLPGSLDYTNKQRRWQINREYSG